MFARATPESAGAPASALLALLNTARKKRLALHGLLVLRRGLLIAEGSWAPYVRDDLHLLHSLSKSFTSTAIGLLIAEGKLALDDTVVDFFRERAPADVSPRLAAMRVRDLLSMQTGHVSVPAGGLRSGGGHDWVAAFLAHEVERQPGTHFLYNSAATYMCSAILQQLTGQSLLDYLRPRLLEPLGIERATWERCPMGVDCGGWGLSLTTEAIARFGQLYLQRGVWEGQRLLDEAWLDQATSAQADTRPNFAPDWEQGYGFQFWRCRNDAFRGDGAFGQYCVVVPHAELVVAITGGVSDLQGVLDLVWKHVLAPLEPQALPENANKQAELRYRLATLALPHPGKPESALAEQVAGRWFEAPAASAEGGASQRGLTACRFELDAEGCSFTFRDDLGEHTLRAGFREWTPGDARLDDQAPERIASVLPRDGAGSARIACGAGWTSKSTLALRLHYLESPVTSLISATFKRDTLHLEVSWENRFEPPSVPEFRGVARSSGDGSREPEASSPSG